MVLINQCVKKSFTYKYDDIDEMKHHLSCMKQACFELEYASEIDLIAILSQIIKK